MIIDLTFEDLTKLAANGKIEKDGTTISIERPVLPDVTVDPSGKSGKVVSSFDKADPRTKLMLNEF